MVNIKIPIGRTYEEHKIIKNPSKTWLCILGIICVIVGVFYILVYFNIIPSQDTSFSYLDRLPVLFVSIAFADIGIYMVWLIVNPKISKSTIPRVFMVIFSLSLLTAFHIVAYDIYKNTPSVFNELLSGYWLMLLLIAIFDLIFIYAVIYFFYKKLKEK